MSSGDCDGYYVAKGACAVRQMNHELNGCRSIRSCFRRNLGIHLIQSGIAWSQTGELHFGGEAVNQHIQLRSQENQGVERRGLPGGQLRGNRTESRCVDRNVVSRIDRLARHAVHVFHGHRAGVRNNDSALARTGSVEGEYSRSRVLRYGRQRGRGRPIRALNDQRKRGARRQLGALHLHLKFRSVQHGQVGPVGGYAHAIQRRGKGTDICCLSWCMGEAAPEQCHDGPRTATAIIHTAGSIYQAKDDGSV